MSINAKIKLSNKADIHDGQVALVFGADYNDGRNKEWSKYTPALSLSMTVLESVAEKFEVGKAYTLTFTPSED